MIKMSNFNTPTFNLIYVPEQVPKLIFFASISSTTKEFRCGFPVQRPSNGNVRPRIMFESMFLNNWLNASMRILIIISFTN